MRDEPPTSDGSVRDTAELSDIETQITHPDVAEDEPKALLVGLTILGHPDRSRVGDRIALPALSVGQSAKLSRVEPQFEHPRTRKAKALGVAHLSRQPIRFSAEDSGAITVDVSASRTTLAADGEQVADSRRFAAAEVDRGVVLELSRRVVLLLHRLPGSARTSRRDDAFVGESAELQTVRDDIERLADLTVPVLVRGETGTGKELVARALHSQGARRNRPFVAVSLATLPPTLAAAELFGAAKGAYTGADRRKLGFFQEADGGTLFLDEIGEAPAELQAMLLRALETGTVTPVGSVEARSVDVRIVAATDADLEQAMAEDQFRSPLFHRLAGFSIHMPTLEERREDIGRLLFHFLLHDRDDVGEVPETYDGRPWPPADLVARLARYAWPGNVRQLRNVARWLAVKGPEGVAGAPAELDRLLSEQRPCDAEAASDAAPKTLASEVERGNTSVTLHRSPSDVSDDELVDALRAHQWRLKPTAKHLRVSRTSLYALIDRCPSIRRASDLTEKELVAVFKTHAGDLIAMADYLEVSPEGLRQRLQEFGHLS